MKPARRGVVAWHDSMQMVDAPESATGECMGLDEADATRASDFLGGQPVVARKMLGYVRVASIDEKVRLRYGAGIMTTGEFVRQALRCAREWSDADKLCDLAYTGADGLAGLANSPLPIDAPALNRKLRLGLGLTEGERAVVDHFARCATELERDVVLYRCVGEDFLAGLAGAGRDYDGLVGAEYVSAAPQSAAPGRQTFFAHEGVTVIVHASAGQMACFTLTVSEGEVVLPAGAICRIEGVRTAGETEAAPVWRSGRQADYLGEIERSGMDIQREGILYPNDMPRGFIVDARLLGYAQEGISRGESEHGAAW